MDLHSKLVSAIEAFDCWEQPWEFYEFVSSTPSLDANNLEELKRVWGTAIESGGWLASKDFADGCSFVDARLASGFPWLSNKARRQLVNGASYQWR
ncbi:MULTISPECIES: hypothetical protein [unclassified Pseudomonas]|uniref:hypothetical protein n=1 Tax=unclassified Pseudomonas TaxID=196821 RepID=UPI001CBAACC5|nr:MULTISPECIES: hypothetical protein [unclassified Pseudomonas]